MVCVRALPPAPLRVVPSDAAANTVPSGVMPPEPERPSPDLPDYAELHCLSAFSFQRGASLATDLFARAKALGYRALAITDECSLAGIVRALEASRTSELPLIIGSEIRIAHGPKVVLLVTDRNGYASLCGLITEARRRAAKGEYRSLREDYPGREQGLLALWIPDGGESDDSHARWLKQRFEDRLWIAVELHRGPDDDAKLAALQALAARHGLPLVAAGDVHMHERSRRALQDTLTAIRHRTTIAEAGHRLFPNGERHLRIRQALAAIYPAPLLAETVRIAERCRFELDKGLNYEYPHELVPKGETPASWLRHLVYEGATQRWPKGLPASIRAKLDYELEVIADLKYEPYFLTVYEIVQHARKEGILCQGRGSAANSLVCYALHITAIDPGRLGMLFERFVSRQRNEPPDIDVDFEHERREEVLQHVFDRYGRDRAALTAVAISYRGRSAIRDVARVLGFPMDEVGELSRIFDRWNDEPLPERLRERGFDPDTPLIRRLIDLTSQLIDFPRHLSQHPGGFVISEHPLHTLVPVENAAMENRTVIQWDKDDLDTLKILKVDCLALGMLTALRKVFELLNDQEGSVWTMERILDGVDDDPDQTLDKATYEMICKADTIGVFQIESRAQMSMLPRLKPVEFYDLVVQIAIVRPGPIQGNMVHPYLQNRKRPKTEIVYPNEELRDVFDRTYGVPLFQEQVMQVAMIAAEFTPDEADALRRSMAAWKRHGNLEIHRERLTTRMLERGYQQEFIDNLFEQIKGFGSYGFPESHAASFALIAYVSSWLKCHRPAAFTCGLINSMPMGFYTPDQLLQDARRHGVRVLPVDVRHSHWDCTLESVPGQERGPAIRMGFCLVSGFDEAVADRLVEARAKGPWRDVEDLCARARLEDRARNLLADAGALRALAGHRHRARWAVAGVNTSLPLFSGISTLEPAVSLPLPTATEDARADYALTGTTLGRHPISLLRTALHARRCMRSSFCLKRPHGASVRVAGLVTLRQQPGTSKGVTFVTLEDEDGLINVVVWNRLALRQRRTLVDSSLLAVNGRFEHVDGVKHVIAEHLEDLTPLLGELPSVRSRDFH